MPATDRDLLRHTVATLAYRAEKVLRDVPPEFARARISSSSRSALEIVSHLGDLIEWGERMAQGEYVWAPSPASDWAAACDRFFAALRTFDRVLQTADFEKYAPGVIFQGPIADALTHVGQLALMRGAAGVAVRPESYARAEIQAGKVGREQSSTRKEFDGDASIKKPKAPPPKDATDEASEESFPASDPPARTPISGTSVPD